MSAGTKTDVLIVGAGFAGAATAFHLSQSFTGSILQIEREKVPGFHASGRNASLVLQAAEHPDVRRLIVSSAQAYAERREKVGFQQHGSILLGSKEQLDKVHQPELIPAEFHDPEQIYEEIPLLDGHGFEAALWTPSDGLMDISALLQFYLEGARAGGVEQWLDCELLEVEGSGPYRLRTSQGWVEADFLINGAGAWASHIAGLCGASELPLFPLKRHLFVLDDIPGINPSWPFVWELNHNFYFRPESGGLLFSICDEEKCSSLEPTVNPDISQSLAELVWVELPALRDATQKEVWSCFRTKTPDSSFVIGWDLKADNFFWVAGLGGHGMGCSWEIGRLAAEGFLDSKRPQDRPFAPKRFVEQLTDRLIS